MEIRTAAALGSILIALTACSADSIVNAPEAGELAAPGEQPALSGSACYEYVNPTWHGGVPTDPDVIALNCGPETCVQTIGEGLYVTVDANGSYVDEAVIRCPDNSIFKVPSTDPCWDCVEGCGGSACPAGAFCSPIPGMYGSDCQAFTCPEGSTLIQTGILQPPTCRRPCLEVSISGPDEIVPGGQCTWTAHATGGSGSYTFNWYNENNWVGSGPSYTGGRPDGTLYPEFRVRVDAWDGSTGKSAQILVKEDWSALPCAM